jgi:serine protease AprX
VITVGALNDHNTPDTSDDSMTTFSSRGPTAIDLVAKPDIVAPGNRIVSLRSAGSYLDTQFPDRRVAGDPAQPDVQDYFEMSGTSMASPIVAATAALMIEEEPTLNPATVKARLMLSAKKPAVGTPFDTGAGLLDILGALRTTGQVASAPSPLVSQDTVTGLLNVENTGVLWSNPLFSIDAIWSNAVVWSGSTQSDQAIFASSGVVLPSGDVWPSVDLWPQSDVWPESDVWPDLTIWSQADLWTGSAVSLDASCTTVAGEADIWPGIDRMVPVRLSRLLGTPLPGTLVP